MADTPSNSKSSSAHPRDEDGKFTEKDHSKSSGSHNGSSAKDNDKSHGAASKDDGKGAGHMSSGSKSDSKTGSTGRSK